MRALLRDLLRDLLSAVLGALLAVLLLRYLHDRWMPEWALICGGIGGVLTRRWVRPSYASFPRYLRVPLSIGLVALGTTLAAWATLAREPMSYWVLRWREAAAMPLVAAILGLGIAALIYTHRRLEREIESRRRIDEDLAVAARIQRNLLRTTAPALPWLQVHAVNHASREVGGDYYELMRQSDGSLCFAVGDVSGKGVAAALLMSTLQSSFLAAHSVHDDLAAVCTHVNDFLYKRTTPERYATMIVGQIAPDGALTYVNAGHNPALLIGPRGARRLGACGKPLGLFPSATYETRHERLAEDEVLVVYTDGVTEAADEHEEEFGEQRLIRNVNTSHLGTAPEIAARLLEAVASHTGGTTTQDDLTLLVLRRNGPA